MTYSKKHYEEYHPYKLTDPETKLVYRKNKTRRRRRLKNMANRKVRKYKDTVQNGDYKKIFDYKWKWLES